jgi:hypothetical protein
MRKIGGRGTESPVKPMRTEGSKVEKSWTEDVSCGVSC